MKIIVCGGRSYENKHTVYATLSTRHARSPITLLIEGGAQGADRFAREWAIYNKVQYKTVPAAWQLHGKKAGYIRNCAMADLQPFMIIAFPGGKGTQMMKDIGKARGIPVMEIEDENSN